MQICGHWPRNWISYLERFAFGHQLDVGRVPQLAVLRFLLCGGILKQGGTGAESHLYVCLRHCSCRPLEAQAGVKYSSAMPKYL